MALHLGVAPAGVLAHVAAAEAVVLALDPELFALLLHQVVHQQQQAARLRRQLVERAAEHLLDEILGQLRHRLCVDSMYSSVWPSHCTVFTGRWYWNSSVTARISVRNFM